MTKASNVKTSFINTHPLSQGGAETAAVPYYITIIALCGNKYNLCPKFYTIKKQATSGNPESRLLSMFLKSWKRDLNPRLPHYE